MPATPRTIVLTSVGTLGDLHPFIAIAIALQARGHRTVLAVAEDQVARVAAAGLAAVPVLPGFDAVRRRLGLSTDQAVKRAMADQRYMLEQIVLPWLSSSTYALDEVLAGADALVATQFVFGASIIAEKRGLPLVTVMLQPMAMLSAHQPPHTPDFWMMRNQPGSLGMQWNRMTYAVIHGVMRQRYGRTIDEVRAVHGLKPAADRSPFDASARATLTIGAYSPVFGPLEPDAPANSVVTGFPLFDGAAEPDDVLDTFLAAGPAPLVFTLGSFAVHAAGDFYAEAAGAARLLGRRAVLLTGGARDLPASDDLLVRDYVAHARVFPRAAAIVHHGGIGTTGQALRAGKPQLVVPHMGDQRDHAHRLKRLGVARSLKAQRFTAARAARRIGKLLDTKRPYLKAAKRIGAVVRKERGAEAAAAAIEAVLGWGVTALGVTRSILGQPWRWRMGEARDVGDNPDDLVTQLLLARGAPRETLNAHRSPSIRDFMPDPSIFRDMDRAAARLADAVNKRQSIAIFGDYDVDGATSAALLILLLRDLGVKASAYIPDRLMEGYGPSGEALVRLKAEGADLVVTVDCGAQAFEALAMARDAGLDVVVVDHHQCAAALPVAHALVNPNRRDEEGGAAHGHLAAVGVTFLLGAALVRVLRAQRFFAARAEPRLLDLLDIVALGTVADVAQLKGLNRAFVAQGLKVMAQRRNIGLAALIDAARLARPPVARDLGFALGPRINAGGRVGRADLGVRLLTTRDPAEARAIAAELDRLNEERRAIEASVQAEAEAMAQPIADHAAIVVAGRGWHPGVIGIVAGRLKQKFGRPAIVIALDEAGIGKGSGRSIGGVDLGAAVLAAKDLGMLVAGGGHAMAAGLTIAGDQLHAFSDFLAERLAEAVAIATAGRALLLDAALAPGGVTPDLVAAMEAGGPYGTGWPAPRIAAGPVRIVKADLVGVNHVRLIVSGDDGRSFKAVAFRAADTPLGAALLGSPSHRRLWLAGTARIDDWAARPAAELHIDDAAWAD